MVTQKEIGKDIEALSKISTVGKYFRDDYYVCLTKAFCTEFGPFEMEQQRNASLFGEKEPITVNLLRSGCIGSYYYFSTIKEIFFKIEDNIKKKLLGEFVVLLNKLTKEIENNNNKKVEIEKLFIEKEKQVKDLEKKVETIQKSNESSSTFKFLDSNEVAVEDYFSADKNSQNFELIENSSFSELPSKNFVL